MFNSTKCLSTLVELHKNNEIDLDCEQQD